MSSQRSFGGLGFLQALTLIFIVLKLTNNIDWSWWWVLFPLWFPFVLAFLYFYPKAYRDAKREAEYAYWYRIKQAIKAQAIYEKRKQQDTTPPTAYIVETNRGRATVFDSNNWE